MTVDAPARAVGSSLDQQLERLLLQRLQHRPQDARTRAQLLQLYFDARREEDFLREATVARALLKDSLRSPEWQLIAELGRRLLPDSNLFAGDAAPVAVQPRRFGEDEPYRTLFANLAREIAPLLADRAFIGELDRELIRFAGRPSPLQPLQRLSERLGGARILIKREDLLPASPALTMAITGEALLARRLGRRRLITASPRGIKGALTAAVAARLGLQAMIFVDSRDVAIRQDAALLHARLCGADVVTVDSARLPRHDLREAAAQAWARSPGQSFLVMGLEAGPPPYPALQRSLTAVAGREVRLQLRNFSHRPPRLLIARGGHTADALGLFPPFLSENATRLVCVNPRADALGMVPEDRQRDVFDPRTAALTAAQRRMADALLEGLEYPSVEREHAWLAAIGRVDYVQVEPSLTRRAIADIARCEGLIPGLRTAQALAWALSMASALPRDELVVLSWNEKSDRDLWDIGRAFGMLS